MSKIIKLFIFWRLGLLLVSYLGSLAFPLQANGGLGAPTFTKPFNYWLSWAQWDGGYYYNIAKRGYLFLSDYAFFPLYPFLIKFLNVIFSNLLLTGLLISNISFLLFLIIFYKFLKEKYSKNIAANSVITFLCFPTTFFAVAYYSEGLFLLLAALVFFFMHRRKILQAAIAIIFASLTRSMGAVLISSLVYNYFSLISFTIKNISKKILYLIPSTFGILLYLTYLFYKLNNPFGFISAQTLWLRNINDPVSTIIANIWIIFTNPNAPLDQYMDLLITLIFLSLLILGVKKISSSLWIFSMLVILIPASTGTLTSMPRYVLASLGAFVILGQLLEENPHLKLPLWATSLFLQAIFATRFISGYWVA
ncbi:hypothetical protein A3B51_02235 [Candidatus Curtissbacteria bacterium RIFCSPLOWO2_01_FULL_41_18]|uniref:Glycosyltransferase RgtA/B/C/D-like domain-containing protein n=2 Tax=Candidatus Curtissiibacteriota TaxID=1752717 RepID=A0A1F5G126_9BACT|nr:MAG: hypothetical protein A2696_03370 [Candidatus Curtissbacteria bacterium RIFCSPHIGHO2_01_FULL_41_13]OGE04386.1 MAG: hypothetical protein A3B51_02235 [Candidatus Curtissbacteria bacterium RIFCSPLOWO2_01_FULL_41_18]